MAISYVGESTIASAGSGTTVQSNSIAGLSPQAGDKLIAKISWVSGNTTATPPAGEGWSSRGIQQTSPYGVLKTQIFEKEWGAGDTDNNQSTFTVGSLSSAGIVVEVWRGCLTGSSCIERVTWNTGSSTTTLTAPDAFAGGSDRVVCRCFFPQVYDSGNDDPTVSSPSEGTLAYTQQYGPTSLWDDGIAMSYTTSESRGNVGTMTATCADNAWYHAATLVLVPEQSLKFIGRSFASQTSGSSTIQSNSIAGFSPQAGDKLLAKVLWDASSSGNSATPPSGEGWAPVAGGARDISPYFANHVHLFEKEWGAGDTDNNQSTFTVGGASLGNTSVAVEVWRGAVTGTSFIDQYSWASNTSNNVVTPPTVTPTVEGVVLARHAFLTVYPDTTSALILNHSEGILAYTHQFNDGGFEASGQAMFYSPGVPASATGSATADFGDTSDAWQGLTLALIPASGVDVAATVNGVATVGATLTKIRSIATQSDGVASVQGGLEVLTELVSQSDGVTTVSGALEVLTDLDAQSDGITSVSGSLDALVPLAGQSDGVASVSAILIPKLEGVIDGSSTVSGSLDALVPIAGQSDGATTLVISLLGDLPITGQVDGVSSVSGTLGVGGTNYVGITTGTSAVAAAMRRNRKITASSGGVSTVSASIIRTGESFFADSNGVTTVAGAIEVFKTFTAQADGDSVVAADPIELFRPISGQVDGVTAVAGTLDELKRFEGASTGAATVSGALEVARSLAVLVSGVGTSAGTVLVQTALEALSDGLASITATLQKVRPVVGQVDGVADVAGTVKVLTDLQADIDGVASVAGVLEVQTKLEAVVTALSAVSGTLDTIAPIEALSEGLASVAGALSVLTAVEVSIAGTSTVSVTLHRVVGVSAQADGVSNVVSDMLNLVPHAASVDGASDVSGALEVMTAVRALVEAASAPQGLLNLANSLIGGSFGSALTAARLNIDGLGMDVVAKGRSKPTGDLSVIKLVTSHAEKDDPRIITRTLGV